MTFIIADRVKETTTTTGTGSIALAGASTGFRAFSAVCANNDTVAYAISSSGGSEWETGLGTWTTGNNLARTTVIASSNANAAVSFSAGTKDVYLSVIAPQVGTSNAECNGRLTLTSGTPITTSDVTAAASIYWTPYLGGQISLYNGGIWRLFRPGELTYSVSATSANNYDMFVWNNAGTVTLSRGPAWTGDNARGTGAGTTELELLEGVWVNKVSISGGPGVREGRFVGTFRASGSNIAEDSEVNRFLANVYNVVYKPGRQFDGTSHTIASVNRVWRAGTQTRVFWVRPFVEYVHFVVHARIQHNGASTSPYIAPYLNGVQAGGGNDSYTCELQQIMISGMSETMDPALLGYNYADVGEAEFSGNNATLDLGRTFVELWQ